MCARGIGMIVVVFVIGVILTLSGFFIYPFLNLYLQTLRAEKYLNKKGKGKVCVITGGAQGIGLESVKLFAKNGWRVFVLDRNEEALDDLKETIEENEWSVDTILCDITNRGNVELAVEAIQNEVNHIACLVNNAGMTIPSATLSLSYEQIHLQMNVNLLGPIYLTKLLKDSLISDKKSSIVINVASVAADAAFPWSGLYCTTKFGVEGFSNALRKEAFMSKLNLKVAVIKPGGVSTRLLSDAAVERKKMVADSTVKSDPFYPGLKSASDAVEKSRENGFLDLLLNEPIDVAKVIYLAANEKHPQHVYHVCRPVYFLLNLMKRLLPSKITDRLPN